MYACPISLSNIYTKYILIMICYVVVSAAYGQDTIRLSMQQAVDIGLKDNPDILIARLQKNSAEYAVREVTGNFLPKVTLNSTYNRNIDKPVIFLPESFGQGGVTRIGLNNNFVSYLDLSVPLYSRYNITTRLNAQRNFLLQKETIDGIQQTVVTNIKKAYTAAQVSRAIVVVKQKSVDNALLNLHNVNEQLTLGTATEFDVASAEVKLATTKNSLLEAQSQLTPIQNNLKVLIHIPLELSMELTDSLFLTDEEISFTAPKELLAGNSTLRQKAVRSELAHEQTRMARSSYLPVLSGTGTYQYQGQQNDFNFSNYRWVLTSAVGLRLQVPLFNGMITRNRVQQAMLSEQIAHADRDYTSLRNEAQFEQLLFNMRYIRDRISIQMDNIRLTQRALSLVRKRFTYGKATFLEVTNAELEFESARMSYLQGVSDYKNTYYDLKLLTGQSF